jgi:hypothetical protein
MEASNAALLAEQAGQVKKRVPSGVSRETIDRGPDHAKK